MRKHKYVLLLAGLISVLGACRDDKKIVTEVIMEDSIFVDSTEWEINNAYTQIKNSLCDTIAFESAKYTNKNTQVYSLNDLDTTKFFLFMSEIDCGNPAGNCGKSIELIHRVGSSYKSIGEYCGKVDSVTLDKKYLYYSTAASRAYRLALVPKLTKSNLIAIHGMPVSDLEEISKRSEIFQDNLILAGEKTENLDAVPVVFIQQPLAENMSVNIYNVDNFNNKLSYAFLYKGKKCVQVLESSGYLSLEQVGELYKMHNMHSEGGLSWTYNPKKKIFLKN